MRMLSQSQYFRNVDKGRKVHDYMKACGYISSDSGSRNLKVLIFHMAKKKFLFLIFVTCGVVFTRARVLG